MCHKRQKSPTAEAVGDSGLDIKVYPNVLPFVNSAFTAQAVHIRFRIFVSYKECRKQQVISVTSQPSLSCFLQIPLSSGTQIECEKISLFHIQFPSDKTRIL